MNRQKSIGDILIIWIIRKQAAEPIITLTIDAVYMCVLSIWNEVYDVTNGTSNSRSFEFDIPV